MLEQVNVHEANTNLSKLLARVQQGEEIIISRSDVLVARLVPIVNSSNTRVAGSAISKITISSDFDDPLSESFLGSFEA